MILYFLLFPQSYHLHLFPYSFGLFCPLRILVCCIYLSFFPLSPFSGALFTRCLFTVDSLLIGVLDNFGAVLYFKEQEKSIDPSEFDFSQVVAEDIGLRLWQTCFAQPRTLSPTSVVYFRGHQPEESHEHLRFSLLFPRIFLALVFLTVSLLLSLRSR